MDPTNATKWLSMNSGGKLKVHKEAASVLSGEAGHVNTIAIIGNVGTAKSTLGNQLTGKKHFKASDALDSVTKGADICKPQSGPSPEAPKMCVCDVEGQADGLGIGWEAKLAAPLVLTSKVLIVNAMCNTGRLSVVAIERLQSVLQVVHMVQPDQAKENMLGHLYIVLRDCPSRMSVKDATCKLLAKEDVGKCPGGPSCKPQAIQRNKLRADIARYFTSATVWCLPKPCTDPTAFSGLLADASPEFQVQLKALKKCLGTQLMTPNFFGAEALTGPMLSQVVAEVADCLNRAPKDSDLAALLNPVTLLESIRERKRLAEEARLAEEQARLAEQKRLYDASVIRTTKESRTVQYNRTVVPIMRTETRSKKVWRGGLVPKWGNMGKKNISYQVQVHAGDTVTKFMRSEERVVHTLGSGQVVRGDWIKVREWTDVQQTK